MPKKIIKTVEIQAGINPDYLENTLTTDISVLESIFDLIDNSIDAARDHLLSKKFDVDKYGLPKNYSGYKISIRLSENGISILDNCLGMEETMLTQKIFITAAMSDHKFGIGHYGLGLKRALLKFGHKYAMSSDNGSIAFKMKFDAKMIAGNEIFTAHAHISSGRRKTLFLVTEIKPNIAFELQSALWFENAVKLLKIRYAIYTTKGLELSITNTHSHKHTKINGTIPSLRTDAKFHPVSIPLSVDGVNIYIDSGIHKEYFFKKETKNSLIKNRELTDDFGLYFICNDRIIVAASTAVEHGWKTKWHSEYNGYVSIVRFVSEDSSKMPWNTLKTALKTDERMFVEVREQLIRISDEYRASVRKFYINKKESAIDINPTAFKSPSTDSRKGKQSIDNNPPEKPEPKQQTPVSKMAGNNQHSHVKNWETLLPSEFPLADNPALNAFIIDALTLKCEDAPCGGALLLRAILEKSLKEFINKSGNFQAVKDHFYTSGEGQNKNHNDEYKSNQGINLSMMLSWLKDEKIAVSVFGIAQKPTLWLSAKKASTHTKKLNGIAHGLDFIDTEGIKEIRNEIYPLLFFCVANSLHSINSQSTKTNK